MAGSTDTQMVDRALAALIDQPKEGREREALEGHPYEDDPELGWEVAPGPALAYDGPVPADVQELADRRRASG